jgi:hypothetical protein
VNPREVQKLILRKLTVGGYGHFREKFLESASLDPESFKDRKSVIERLRLNHTAPINDGSKRRYPSGYEYVYSGDFDTQLAVDRLDLPPRIKEILEGNEDGEYFTILFDGSRVASRAESVGGNRSSSPKQGSKERTGSVDPLASVSEVSLSAGEDRQPRKKSKAPVRKEDSTGWRGQDGIERSLSKARVSESRPGSADSSRGSGLKRPRKARRPG